MDTDEMSLDEARNLIHAGKIAEGRPAGSRAGDGCPACHYCDVPLGKARHEHDHAPIPAGEGGTLIVAACLDLPNVVTCRSFSKGRGAAGIRVGFAVVRDPDLDRLLKTVQPAFAAPEAFSSQLSSTA